MKKYKLALLFFVISFTVAISVVGFFVKREIYISEIKKQLKYSTEILNAHGLDIAYDNLSFSYVPFTRIMKAESFRVYNIYNIANFDWYLGEISVKDNFFNFNKMSIFPSQNETLTLNNHKFNFSFKEFRIVEEYTDKNINKLKFEFKEISVDRLFAAEELNLNVMIPEKGKITSQNAIELKKVQIADDIQTPLLRKVDRILLKFSTFGNLKAESKDDNIWKKWIDNNGYATIEKFVIRWEPLVLVGKGGLTFDSNKEGNIKLNTTSKGLTETLEMLNEGKVIDSSSYYVVKILIDGKAYKLKDADDYKTVTTSLVLKGNKVLLENVPLYEYKPQK